MNVKTGMSLFIVAIMILSVIGFVLVDVGTDDASRMYGNYTFYRTSQGWRAKIAGQQMYFNFLPDQVNRIPVDEHSQQILTSSPIVGVTYDPADKFAQPMSQLQFYLEQLLNENQRVFVLRGLTNNSAYPGLQELTCANATQSLPVIVMERQNETRVSANEWCVHAQAATSQEVFMLADRLLYVILGVL